MEVERAVVALVAEGWAAAALAGVVMVAAVQVVAT